MWRAGAKAKLAALTLLGGAGAAAIATSDDPSSTFKICTIVPLRLIRDSVTAATMAFDYQYSLWGLKEGSIEWLRAKHEVHNRCAYRLQELCFRNGGIYIKLGQHIGQLEYVVPREYVQTMRASMLKRCPVSSYDQVRSVFVKELGEPPEKIFAEFDPVPLASASLAQVHAAKTHDGEKVAVKVQHTHLTDTAIADIATVGLVVNFLHWFFPAFDYRWLVDEIRESAPKELDFLFEARNSEKCLDNFRRLSPHMADSIYAPKVYWNLSTSRLLTMEFMDAAEITDVSAMQKLGIQPIDVSKLVSQAFAEMTFKHGFVHCDPHAANMMVRPLPSSKWNCFGKRKPQLILLDHGLYKELDFETKTNYAALWKALIFADVNAIKENSVKLGAGEDLYALFAGVLTMRPWSRVIDPSVDHLVLEGKDSDRSELQMYASQYFSQISELLRRLPRVILLMLKTNDCIRAVTHALIAYPKDSISLVCNVKAVIQL
ncbi:putative ABC1 protein At2g40090 isoform X2 [Phoenix dactylifera]|uniref:ABC1 protein At2g40090 isoform X2 n=1 Tax=Phoenix dactylifera TaxID=42345 RepID=A0A8B7BU18_PHODC|nr:putative ABC1 protein At2g40090 isoform X2 [Phoenix dactylifera]